MSLKYAERDMNKKNYKEFNNAINQLQSAALNFGQRFIKDANVRLDYIAKTQEMSRQLSFSVESGILSAREAAEAANQMRNEIMEAARLKSSDLGQAKAKALKSKGLNLDNLTIKYSKRMFDGKSFQQLTKAQQDDVLLTIVKSAGRANVKVNARAARLGSVGRGLWVFTIVVAVYNISVAEDKLDAAGREVSSLVGGFSGGAAAGALAGVWFGPIGVAVGVIIGGVLGAIAADQIYVEVTGPSDSFVKRFLPKYTNVISVDEEGIAKGLITDCGIDMRKVYAVFKELDNRYSMDSDDVALLYIEYAKRKPNIFKAIKLYPSLKNLLVLILDSGWTTNREYKAIASLRYT